VVSRAGFNDVASCILYYGSVYFALNSAANWIGTYVDRSWPDF